MSGPKYKYDEKTARATERAYLGPEITAQRMTTLDLLALKTGEHVLDIGTGPGLLSHVMSQFVGDGGRVAAIDNASAMVGMASRRCADLSNVEVSEGDAQGLDFADGSFDAVVCTQVLLYVDDVHKALSEMCRVLKPGGRALILETDWRGLVLNTAFPQLTETMIQSWDDSVASPRLPPVLEPVLREAGFSNVRVSAIPVICIRCGRGDYARSMLEQFRDSSVEQGQATSDQARQWFDDQLQKSAQGEFFFCINRFVFTAHC